MIIDEDIIKDIFNLKIKMNGDDKKILSKYQDLIPMYDIYSKQIYPIKKENLYDRLINCDYRFINDEIHKWLERLYKKHKNDKILSNKFKTNLLIIDNYDLEILKDTSYKTLYEFSPNLGLSVSICQRKSFNPFIKHLKPYYTKLELIKLGQNMDLIEDINMYKLLNRDFHYDLCKKISANDVTFEEIESHTIHIIKKNIIQYITFYSFFGSFLYNNYLRKKKPISQFLIDGIKKICSTIKSSPGFKNDYYIYRFVRDDNYIADLEINDITTISGFLSATRDPFYSPGLAGIFGLTLLKIHLPKNKHGLGLFIENFSLFPNEEEILLPPNCLLKLISKNDKFQYYHINHNFEKLIKKKYEFELIDIDYSFINNLEIKKYIYIIDDITTFKISGNDRLEMFINFMNYGEQTQFTINGKSFTTFNSFYDSSERSSYHKLYHNKIKDGLLISIYDDGYPFLNIECGYELIINYSNIYYYYGNTKKEFTIELLDIVLEFGRIFNYNEAKILYTYRNFSNFTYPNLKNNIFQYMYLYNHTLYDYAKNNNKFLVTPFVKNNIGWYKLTTILDTDLTDNIKKKFNFNCKTIRDALIYIIENEFYLYDKFLDCIDFDKKQTYFIFEIYEKLNYQNRTKDFKFIIDNIEINNELGEQYQMIFRQSIRRSL